MADQSEIYRKINAQLRVTNQTLRDQAVLHEAINSLLASGLDAVAGSGERVDEMLKKQGVTLANSYANLEKKSKQATDSVTRDAVSIDELISDLETRGQTQAASALENLKGMYKGAKIETNKALKTAQDSLNFIGGDVSKKYYEIQAGIGGNVLATNRQFTNSMTTFLMDETDRLYELYQSQGEDGRKAFQAVFPSFEAMLGYLDAHAEKGMVAYQIMKKGNEDALLANQMYARGLHISNEEMAELEIRQMSRTGKVTTDMMTQMVTFAKAIEKQTGIASKDVGEAMSALIRDSDRFANLTVKNAARAAMAIGKIGISVEDLGQMMSGFDGFERSIESASTLQSVFGGVLDPIEMMFASKNDPAGALMQLQQWFRSTGRDIQTMGAYGKDLIREIIPGLDVPTMERLFAPGAGPEEIADLAKSLEGVQQLDEQTAMKAVQTDLELVGLQSNLTAEAIENKLAKALTSRAAPAAAKAKLQFEEFANVLPVTGVDKLSTAVTDLAGLTEKDITKAVGHLNKLTDGLVHMLDKAGRLDPQNALGPLVETFDQIGGGIAKSIVKYMTEMKAELEVLFDALGVSLANAFNRVAKKNSPLPPVQLAILKYMNQTAKSSVEGFNKAFEPKNFTSLKDFQGAMKEAVAGKEVEGSLKKFVEMTDDELKNIEEKVKSGDFDIGSMGLPFQRFDLSKEPGFQGISEQANKQLMESMLSLAAEMDSGPLNSVAAIHDKMTEIGSPLANMINALKEANVPFGMLTDSTKTMLKDLGRIKDDDLLKFAYDGGDEMSKFKKDFGHIEDKLKLLKDSSRGMSSLSINQLNDVKSSLKAMTGNYSEEAISAALKDTSKLQEIINDEKSRLADIVRLKSENTNSDELKNISAGTDKEAASRSPSGALESVDRSIGKLTRAINNQNAQPANVYATIDLVLGNDKLRILTDKLLRTRSTTGESINQSEGREG